jgi:hypothetical protein
MEGFYVVPVGWDTASTIAFVDEQIPQSLAIVDAARQAHSTPNDGYRFIKLGPVILYIIRLLNWKAIDAAIDI